MSDKLDAANSIVRRSGVPPGWRSATVADLARIVGGGTPEREQPAYWRDASIPWITPTDLTANDRKMIASGAEGISELALRNSNATLVPTGSIIFSTRGTVGRIAVTAVPLTCNQSCEILVPKTEQVDGDLLYYLLRFGHSAFIRLSGGTTFSAITRSDIARVRFAVPTDPDEQAAIARILDAVDTALERTRAAVERARDVRRALTQEILTKGVRGESQKKTAIGFMPRSWEAVPLSSTVGAFQYGLSIPMELTGKLPILRMGNLQAGSVVLDELKYVSLPGKLTAPYLLQAGDVLFNRTNSQELVGKVAIFRHEQPAVFASYLIRLVPDGRRIDNYYLGHVLGSYATQCRIKRYATPGVQQVNINATNLGKVLIPLPVGKVGHAEQRDIAAILEEADSVTRSYAPMLAAQRTLKASLMHDLLAGRVRVPYEIKAAAE